MDRLKALWARVQQLKPMRANQRYNQVRGNLLSAGVGYYSFFSVFPALAIAGVVFGFILRDNPQLLASVGDALNQALPGFIKTASNPGGLIELTPPSVSLLTIGGIIAVVSLVLSGMAWISSFRDAIRAAFGAVGSPGNMITDKLRDLGVFFALGSAFLVSAVLTSVLGAATEWVSEHVGLGQNTAVVTAVGLLVGYAVDTAVLLLLLRVLSGLKLPLRQVLQGALVGAFGLGVVKFFGVQLIHSATRNPLLGSVALVVGLLFWLNLIARLVLLSACWAFLDIDPAIVAADNAAHESKDDESTDADATGPSQDESAPVAQREPLVPAPREPLVPAPLVTSAAVRERDRASLVSGAVLGAAAALVAAPAVKGLRARLRR